VGDEQVELVTMSQIALSKNECMTGINPELLEPFETVTAVQHNARIFFERGFAKSLTRSAI
jgi:hypothetical protein